MEAESHYTKQALMELVDSAARTKMRDEKDIVEYYQRFLTICNPLLAANLILDNECNAEFFKGFHPEDRMAMTNHLYPLHFGRL